MRRCMPQHNNNAGGLSAASNKGTLNAKKRANVRFKLQGNLSVFVLVLGVQ